MIENVCCEKCGKFEDGEIFEQCEVCEKYFCEDCLTKKYDDDKNEDYYECSACILKRNIR